MRAPRPIVRTAGSGLAAAALLAAGAAGAIGMALRLTAQVALTEQLQTALASRAVIDQAIG
ncbi:MAG: hypothetical protein ACR2FU_08340, partial [Streptosporangiaceae bacterium]